MRGLREMGEGAQRHKLPSRDDKSVLGMWHTARWLQLIMLRCIFTSCSQRPRHPEQASPGAGVSQRGPRPPPPCGSPGRGRQLRRSARPRPRTSLLPSLASGPTSVARGSPSGTSFGSPQDGTLPGRPASSEEGVRAQRARSPGRRGQPCILVTPRGQRSRL